MKEFPLLRIEGSTGNKMHPEIQMSLCMFLFVRNMVLYFFLVYNEGSIFLKVILL